MNKKPALRLAITGAPRTGKTTVSTAVSIASGLSWSGIDADQSFLWGDRKLAATVGFAVRGYERRLDSEARSASGFISDGSVLNEWALAESRCRIQPLANWREPGAASSRMFEIRFLQAYSAIVARRASVAYDAFVHLPIDPGTACADVRVRTLADQLLRNIQYEADIPCLVVGGSLAEIVTRVLDWGRLPRVVPVDDAIAVALIRSHSGAKSEPRVVIPTASGAEPCTG